MSTANVAVLPGRPSPVSALEAAFPEADPGVVPFGQRLLVQIRSPKTRSAGGIIIPEDTKDTEKWNTQVAKVIAMGPICFRDRTTMELWPEGQWCQPGDFVRVPKYGGDRWEVPIPGGDKGDTAMFVIFRDLDVVGAVTGDPLAIKAFI